MKQFLFQPNCRIDGRSKLWPQICHIWGKQQNGCTLPRPSIFGPHELVPIFGPHELVPIFGPHELVPIFGPYESITIFGPYESITIFGPYFRNIFSIIFFNSLIHNLSIECDSCGKIFLMLVIWEDTSKLFMKVTKISNVNLV